VAGRRDRRGGGAPSRHGSRRALATDPTSRTTRRELKWFREGERGVEAASSLRGAYAAGDLFVFAPSLLGFEILNVTGRRWGWQERALIELADSLNALGFELVEPELSRVARWTARGLTAYDAAYVALAEAAAIELVTDDDLILSVAPSVATRLADAVAPGR
jgi:predicted nucleic acid-binding protein